MHGKHFLSTSTNALFLVSTRSALWEDAAACLRPSEAERGASSQRLLLIAISRVL